MSNRGIAHLTDEEKRKRLTKLRSMLKKSSPGTVSKDSRRGVGTVVTATSGFTPDQEQYLKLLSWEKKNK